ncbi:uncharacterized protein LOC130626771 [Hydractinia symbiolongicarpus]|uniref:uncharacterized protein LOC130626771 n=1 Tax=Hydractinia symbiolongicarpus TaxID=13093 RepID=UPI00255154FF|nr:uncharacterized protein LOC130626771 [Hydractinia symbiolongicarpus]
MQEVSVFIAFSNLTDINSKRIRSQDMKKLYFAAPLSEPLSYLNNRRFPVIMEHSHNKFKGENRVKSLYAGISCHRIQAWINNKEKHFKLKPKITNKDELIDAEQPMERLQVDLVNNQWRDCKLT